MPDIFLLLLFLGITTLVFLIGRYLLARKPSQPAPPRMFSTFPTNRWTIALSQLLPLPQKTRLKMAKELIASGRFQSVALDEFLAQRNGATMIAICLLAFVLASGLADGYEVWALVIGIVTCILCFSIPRVTLSRRASRRTQQIEKGIPDALDMIAMSVSSGMPVEEALQHVAIQLRRSNPSIAQELQILVQQTRTGSIEQAFSSFATRIDLPEVVAWCAVMSQSHALGGGIADALCDYSSRIRRDRRTRAERSGNTASIKLLLPVVTCLCPPVAVMLVGPALLDLRDFLNRNKDEMNVVAPLQRATDSQPAASQ